MDEIAAGSPIAPSSLVGRQETHQNVIPPQTISSPIDDKEACQKLPVSHASLALDRSPQSAARTVRPLPRNPKCQLATLIATPPSGDEWLHEMKFDGYRMLGSLNAGQVKFTSRNGLDWTARMQPLVKPVTALKAEQAVFDGEVVVLDSHGISHFQSLQNAFRGSGGPLVYCVFDLLYLDGYDLTRVPLEQRKSLLQKLLPKKPRKTDRIRFSDHVTGSGEKFFRKMCKAGLEGMISKQRDAPYVPGRSLSWLKCKCRQEQELVIGGFTQPSGSRVGFGALLLGYYDRAGKLRYAGRVGTGFDTRLLRELHAKLKRLQQSKSPFATFPPGHTRGVFWVRPELVAEVQFNNWTDEGLLRQAAFLGLREDKPARQVKRELPSHV